MNAFTKGAEVHAIGRRGTGWILRRGAVIDSWVVSFDGEAWPLTYLETELRGVAA